MTAPGGPPAPGWWMASDGRWYPPNRETPPDTQPGTVPVDEPTATTGTASATPAWLRKSYVPIGIAVVAAVVIGIGVMQVTGADDKPMTMEEVLETDLPDDGYGDDGSSLPDVRTEEGYSTTTNGHVGADLEDLDDAELIGVDYRMTVQGAGIVEDVVLPSGPHFPAEGDAYLIVRYDLIVPAFGNPPDIAIDVDGVKGGVDLNTGPNTLVYSLDEDTKLRDVGLHVLDSDTEQTLALATGRPMGDRPAILYREDRDVSILTTLSFGYEVTNPAPNGCEGGGGRLSLSLGDGELAWSRLHSRTYQTSSRPGADLPPPTEGAAAWFVVEVSRYSAEGPNRSCTYTPEIPAAQVVVVADDGTEYANQHPLASGTRLLLFEVPADVRRLRLEVRPGEGVLDGQEPTATYAFGGATQQVPLVFTKGSPKP